MRRVFALLLLLPCLLPVFGCGGGKPDPRSRPDFVDTTDPSAAADMLDADRPQPKR
jgi:hypothetical protein